MASHTWNGYNFDEEVQVDDSGDIRAGVDHDVPGVNGIESSDQGWRGRFVTISGRHVEASIQALRSWVASLNSTVRTVTASLLLYGGDDELQYTRLNSFRAPILRRTQDGKYAVRYVAAFQQLRPND